MAAAAATAATVTTFLAGHGLIAVFAGGCQAVQVFLPQHIFLRAQAVQVFPGEDAALVPVAERGLDGVVAHGLQVGNFHAALAGLQRLLPGAVAHDFGGRGIHAQQFKRQGQHLPVGIAQLQHARCEQHINGLGNGGCGHRYNFQK